MRNFATRKMGGQSQNLKKIDDLNGHTRRLKKVKHQQMAWE